jgi:hypothetical protein
MEQKISNLLETDIRSYTETEGHYLRNIRVRSTHIKDTQHSITGRPTHHHGVHKRTDGTTR